MPAWSNAKYPSDGSQLKEGVTPMPRTSIGMIPSAVDRSIVPEYIRSYIIDVMVINELVEMLGESLDWLE